MSTLFSTACLPPPDIKRRLRRLATVAGILALTANVAVAEEPAKATPAHKAMPAEKPMAQPKTPAERAPETPASDKASSAPQTVDPVTEAVQEDALTQIRIAAISFQSPKDLGQALSGVIGAFLMRDRLKDALVDLSVIHDPAWRASALLHFAEYHYQRGELGAAKGLLLRADALTQKIPAESDAAKVLALVSQRLAEHGDYAAARRTAARISGPKRRIARLIDLGELQGTESNRKVSAGGVDSFRLAFEQTQKATLGKEERMALLLEIADHATSLGYKALARQILEFAFRLDEDGPIGDGPPEVARLAAGMVRAGERGRAMEIVRALKNDTRRGYALAAVARAFAATGSIEGAVPLFYLAIQDADSLVSGPHKIKLLAYILKEQTYAGRLADAFSTAGKIKDRVPQENALYAMAEILFDRGKPLEAVKLADYVPDPGMRAEILAKAARFQLARGDKRQAQALLVEAVKPTGAKPNPETLAKALPLVIETQFDMRKGPTRDKVLAGARKLLELIPDAPPKVPVMTRIARAEMHAQEKDAADRSLGMAWRIAWFNKDKEIFPELLSTIAMAQLNIGEILLAFDTAARISENSNADVNELEADYGRRDNPKAKALTAIAVSAARRGEGQLALRVARAILDPSGRASAYREIALALPLQSQQAKLGDGSTSALPNVSPNLSKVISPAVNGAPMPAEH